jgi:ketosteroid isomerase-like protein
MNRQPYRAAFAALVVALITACSAKVSVDRYSTGMAEATLQAAKAADKAFSDYAQTAGMGEAFAKYMDGADGEMIGEGDITKGEAAIRAAFKDWPADVKMIWSPDGGYGAGSGDIAVTTGRYARTRNGADVGQGRYVTVWRKNAAGEWKGVMDIGAADPPPKKPVEPDPQGRPG